MVMRRTVNAYYVGSTPTLPAKNYAIIAIFLALSGLSSCLSTDSVDKKPTLSYVGEVRDCELLRVKVQGMPPQLVLHCPCDCDNHKTQCKLK